MFLRSVNIYPKGELTTDLGSLVEGIEAVLTRAVPPQVEGCIEYSDDGFEADNGVALSSFLAVIIARSLK